MARFPHGARLRAARLSAGISAERAAIEIGRTAYTIAGYETGKIEPPIHALADLAAMYGTTVGALLDEQVPA
jgi:transcriptional regulator with XRE-family HTH domain